MVHSESIIFLTLDTIGLRNCSSLKMKPGAVIGCVWSRVSSCPFADGLVLQDTSQSQGVPGPRKQGKEDLEFKLVLSYLVSVRPAWATWGPASKQWTNIPRCSHAKAAVLGEVIRRTKSLCTVRLHLWATPGWTSREFELYWAGGRAQGQDICLTG